MRELCTVSCDLEMLYSKMRVCKRSVRARFITSFLELQVTLFALLNEDCVVEIGRVVDAVNAKLMHIQCGKLFTLRC